MQYEWLSKGQKSGFGTMGGKNKVRTKKSHTENGLTILNIGAELAFKSCVTRQN